MSLDKILSEVRDRGLRIVLAPSGPQLQGKTREATPALLNALKAFREEIVARLRDEAKLGEPVDWHGGRLVELKGIGWVVEADLGPCPCGNEKFVIVANGSQRRLVCGKCVRLNHGEQTLGIIYCTRSEHGQAKEAAGNLSDRPAR